MTTTNMHEAIGATDVYGFSIDCPIEGGTGRRYRSIAIAHVTFSAGKWENR